MYKDIRANLLQVRKTWRNIWFSFYTHDCISIPYGMPAADINTHKSDFCTTPYIVLHICKFVCLSKVVI